MKTKWAVGDTGYYIRPDKESMEVQIKTGIVIKTDKEYTEFQVHKNKHYLPWIVDTTGNEVFFKTRKQALESFISRETRKVGEIKSVIQLKQAHVKELEAYIDDAKTLTQMEVKNHDNKSITETD